MERKRPRMAWQGRCARACMCTYMRAPHHRPTPHLTLLHYQTPNQPGRSKHQHYNFFLIFPPSAQVPGSAGRPVPPPAGLPSGDDGPCQRIPAEPTTRTWLPTYRAAKCRQTMYSCTLVALGCICCASSVVTHKLHPRGLDARRSDQALHLKAHAKAGRLRLPRGERARDNLRPTYCGA